MHLRESILLLAAVLLAALVATVLATLLQLAQIEDAWTLVIVYETFRVARFVFYVALAHALLLGLPIFLRMRSRRRVGIVSSAVAGFIIGAVPLGGLTFFSMLGMQNASSGGKPTIINHVPTLAGLIEFFLTVGIFGCFGLAGGVTFWAALCATGQEIGPPTEFAHRSHQRRIASWSVVSLAVILSAAIVFLPRIVWDKSCHNLFRDGRSSVGPEIFANIKLNAEDWTALADLFAEFSQEHALSLRSGQTVRHGELISRKLSLCSEAGVNIEAIDQPWVDNNPRFPLSGRGILFSIYEMKAGSDWNALAREMLSKIESRWPEKTTFRGPMGQVLPSEDALKGRP